MALPAIKLPNVTLLHIPGQDQAPITLATGELSLTQIEPNILALSVDHATFKITPKNPISPTDTLKAHPSYLFVPISGTDSATAVSDTLGKIKVVLKESTSPSEYENNETFVTSLKAILDAHQMWKEPGYYDLEDEQAKADPSGAGYGTTIADTLTSYAQMFSNKLAEYTDSHVKTTSPTTNPLQPGATTKSVAAQGEDLTQRIAEVTHVVAQAVQTTVHDAAKVVGEFVHDKATELDAKYGSDKPPGPIRQQVNETAKGVKEMGEDGWEEVSLAASGAKEAAITAGTAMSENAHRGIEHNYGKEADNVAKVVGQSSANVGAAGYDASMTTMGYVHGINAATGAGQGLAGQK